MLLVGFFENLPSERAIAARYEDSLAVRAFLGYRLDETTPDHSSLSVIRHRLPARPRRRHPDTSQPGRIAQIGQALAVELEKRSKATDYEPNPTESIDPN